MDILYSKWYEAIAVRRSCRHYDPDRAVPGELLTQMRKVCSGFRPFPHARAELITGRCDEIFKGLVGSYGKIKGAGHTIAFIGDMRGDHVQEQTGYLGEGIILEATSLNLATCWVGGFFRPEKVASLIKVERHEKVLSVTPLGYIEPQQSREAKYMTGFGRMHKRQPLSSLVTGIDPAGWPEWIKTAVEAARMAPSAINRQPWSFQVEPSAITVSVRTKGPQFTVAKRLDCGIAMLHIEAAAIHCGIQGSWTFLKAPHVARFQAAPG
jgi:nitroreductase